MNHNGGIIVLVDDEPGLSQALAFTLESAGFECVTAVDMSSGLEVLENEHVLAVVTDVMMPAGPRFPTVDSSEAGFHFIDVVKERWPDLPIVCLSVIGDQDKIHSLTRRGVRYLRKGETPLSTAVEVITAVATGRRI